MSFPENVTIINDNRPSEELYKTSGLYVGSDTIIAATELYTNDILIKNENSQAKVTVRYKPVSGIVDALEMYLYDRIDNNIWEDIEKSIYSDTLEKSANEILFTYTIRYSTHGAGYYRFGFKSAGGTTSYNLLVTVKYSQSEIFGS